MATITTDRGNPQARPVHSGSVNDPTSDEDRSVGEDYSETTTAQLLGFASAGDQRAWNELFARFDPLVRNIARSYRLDHETVADVCQTTWLRLFEHVDRIRQPERLAGWLATTTRNEALRCSGKILRNRPCGEMVDRIDDNSPLPDERTVDNETLAEVMSAFAELPDHSQEFLRLVMATPPIPYVEIASRLGRSVGSIGPTRRRCITSLEGTLAQRGLL